MVKSRSSKPSLWVRIPLPLYALLVRSLFYKTYMTFYKILNQNSYINTLFILIVDWFLTLLKISKLEKKESDISILYLEWEKKLLHVGFF